MRDLIECQVPVFIDIPRIEDLLSELNVFLFLDSCNACILARLAPVGEFKLTQNLLAWDALGTQRAETGHFEQKGIVFNFEDCVLLLFLGLEEVNDCDVPLGLQILLSLHSIVQEVLPL